MARAAASARDLPETSRNTNPANRPLSRTPAMAMATGSRLSTRSSKLVLVADSRGHFIDRGFINGKAMQYMVDTGASTIAIGRTDADRMGLPYKSGTPIIMRTANGNAEGWRIKLNSVKLGDLEIFGVDAVVGSESMPYVLLGNNVLSQFQMTRTGTEMVLQKN